MPIFRFVLFAFVAIAAAAQTPTATIHVNSRETVVDVTVRDAKGHPVHGLKEADFALKEDGKPQSLRSFKEVVANPAPADSVRDLPANVYTNVQPAPPSEATNILLLDFVNLAPDCDDPSAPAGKICLGQALELQRLMKQEAARYIQSMPLGTRVALIAMTWPSSLRLVQGVTSDPALLTAALGATDVVTVVVTQDNKFQMTLESLNQVAAIANQIKGRKNLIWFTYGLAAMTDHAVCVDCTDYTDRYHIALSNLTAAQVSVYPIGSRGVYNDVPGRPSSLVRAPAIGVARASEPNAYATEALALESIAEAGGGVAYHDSNDLKTGIARAVESGSEYYTLSYVPPGTEYDGRHHTIQVKVAQPNLHLTYRTYYYAEDPAKHLPPPGLTFFAPSAAPDLATLRDRTMTRGLPASTQILFDVEVAPASHGHDGPTAGILNANFRDKPLTCYDLDYAVPVAQITLARGAGGIRKGAVEFDVAAFDASGALVTTRSQTLNLKFSEDDYLQFLQSPFKFPQQIDLPPGLLFLRIAVIDTLSGKTGSLELALGGSKK